MARVGQTLVTLVFGFVISVLTARWLGPSGKGTLSALSFLGDIFFFYLCGMGLGEAAIILIGQGRTTAQRAVSAGVLPLGMAGTLGVAGLFVVAIPADWFGIWPAVLLQGVALILMLYMSFFQSVLIAQERLIATSFILSLRTIVTAVCIALLLSRFRGELTAALAGICAGLAFGVVGLVGALKRRGISFRPVLDRGYLMLAARYGFMLQAAYLSMAMAQRLDQLMVYSFSGTAAGGRYAVALTLGQLPSYIPVSLSYAAFPRLARTPQKAGWDLTAQVSRVGLIGGVMAAALLAVGIPTLTPIVFGDAYRASALPSMVLLIGGLLFGQQWTLARAWAARGRMSLLLSSFVAAVSVMLAFDLILIPRWELMGAAIASVVGSAVGLGICLEAYRRDPEPFRIADLIPRRSDLGFLIASANDLVTGRSRTEL